LAGAPATAQTDAPTAKITKRGVGDVRIGATFRELRDAGLVGRMHGGCELAGPGTRAADLRPTLRGSVDFTTSGKPRVRNVTVLAGGAARGVEVGDRGRKIRRAFPGARFDHSTDEVFGVTLVTVPRRAGGRLQFLVSTE